MASLFNDIHGCEVFMFPSSIRYPGITHGHLDILVPKDLLQNFQTHTGVEHICCESVSEAMEAVPFILQTRTVQRFSHNIPGGDITDAWSSHVTRKEKR